MQPLKQETTLESSRVIHQPTQSPPARAQEALYNYLPDGTSFVSYRATSMRTVYFPMCGTDAGSLKSSITPRLSGDIKIDKDRYLTKPVSTEDLRQGLRNFFCHVQGKGIVSLTEGQDIDASVEAGMFWHKLKRAHAQAGIAMEALNFVPVSGENAELMRITVRNISEEPCDVTPTFSLALFARSLANKHDHEHVTSLLHRIEQLAGGVCVEPTMVFDERGHRLNASLYYVLGADSDGKGPVGSFPTFESFYGDDGSASAPEAVVSHADPLMLPREALQGREAVGALRFARERLAPGASKQYFIVMGICSGRQEMFAAAQRFLEPERFEAALDENKAYWNKKAGAIFLSTGDESFNAWMRWVTVQPVLRRIFGCSFLPDHDYGKGGKGWRDIWQDLLSLILIEPENIRGALVNNFAGVRIDGSNATIVGLAPGEFLADRNAITRVWSDHGAWPLMTLLLYIQQTGDYDVLLEQTTYFRDAQLSRGFRKEGLFNSAQGHFLRDKNGAVYRGSLIEHVLTEHLVQFFNVGEHNVMRLEDADWNDGLDMARERGESVAFMSLYGGNLLALADALEKLMALKNLKNITLAPEIGALLDSLTDAPVDYADARAKRKLLFESYFPSVEPCISGERVEIPLKEAVEDLRRKGQWIFSHLQDHERIVLERKGLAHRWFNGYYDNKGVRVEGDHGGLVRMTLVGQVFPVMSGLAGSRDIEDVILAVEHYLKDRQLGGIRLNTDFGLKNYMDLGRAFGFAYGTKENGAFFNHMTVMYAYGLYKRGFAREGYNVLRSIYAMCADSARSKIYPGIPEYLDSQGRGRYHYLTGSASWMILTVLTQAFGIRGEGGDLLLAPQLMREEFHPQMNTAAAASHFAGKNVTVTYENPGKLDEGMYGIREVTINGEPVVDEANPVRSALISRKLIEQSAPECSIRVVLEAL